MAASAPSSVDRPPDDTKAVDDPEKAVDTGAAGTSTFEEIFPRAYVAQIFTEEECAELLARFKPSDYEDLEAEYPPEYRAGSRVIFDDTKLANTLFERILAAIPPLNDPVRVKPGGCSGRPMWISGCEPGDWVPHSLNYRFRLNKTGSGQHFSRHRDGMYHIKPPHIMGCMSLLLYLSTMGPADGGRTLLFHDEFTGRTAAGKKARKNPDQHVDSTPSALLRPKAGQVLVFDHGILHMGEEVKVRDKYVLRTDVEFCTVEYKDTTARDKEAAPRAATPEPGDSSSKASSG